MTFTDPSGGTVCATETGPASRRWLMMTDAREHLTAAFLGGEEAPGAGWIGRARRLLEDDPGLAVAADERVDVHGPDSCPGVPRGESPI